MFLNSVYWETYFTKTNLNTILRFIAKQEARQEGCRFYNKEVFFVSVNTLSYNKVISKFLCDTPIDHIFYADCRKFCPFLIIFQKTENIKEKSRNFKH